MQITSKDLVDAANAVVPRIDTAAAQEKIAQGALLLDIRDSTELEKTGRAEGSHHIPRGMLEFRADPASPYHDPQMRPDRVVVLHCASGGRAALAGKLLKDMGYAEVYNLGGFRDWKEAGGPVQEPVDPGM
ncbi:MAG: rhodanese-like domain-containing protein [Rhodobacter sp.]|jgi:rhodanese-related sulfurtransferase|nr:rhodanese-like domain-containing protein [Rhodobacter sp.]MCA3492090.1 rhodanese-like domain-containing protein [Rhodobacter sp.]MCA3499202.1 rhodanese-like domain-containing protein [Rhodobacter sp.]MCA3503628.1 rhodanese-like domain-containing protein [Rhodobacter sp.]MCA3518271.1 rhodanese-like domain-containing protein [Rhodobacter sp.]